MAIQKSNTTSANTKSTDDKSYATNVQILVDGVDIADSDQAGLQGVGSEQDISETSSQEENKLDDTLRPSSFKEIVGRTNEKKTLKIMINAAKQNKRSLDHILFYGPPGLGKTTFALAISNEMGSHMHITSGPAIDKQGDLAAILTNLGPNDILFIDEVHRLSKNIEEILYPAMEDGVLDIVMGKGTAAKNVRIALEPFTLVGATTQVGKISSPMRDRFGLVQRLDYFEAGDIAKIVKRAADLDSIGFDADALENVAMRSRGTGRIALRLYRRVRDFHQSERKDQDTISMETVDSALHLLGIDEHGLEQIDRKVLEIMAGHFGGGPVGLSTLAAAVAEDVTTISEVYEPFLLKKGFIQRTSRGRILTEKGSEYIESFI